MLFFVDMLDSFFFQTNASRAQSQLLIGRQTALPTRVNQPDVGSWECFSKSSMGPEGRRADVAALVSEAERFQVFVELIYCSVSEHGFKSVNF